MLREDESLVILSGVLDLSVKDVEHWYVTRFRGLVVDAMVEEHRIVSRPIGRVRFSWAIENFNLEATVPELVCA
jgi:hypothetical protein